MRVRLRLAFRAVASFTAKIDRSLDKRLWLFLGISAILLAAAAYIRVWAAPISAGPDVAQFWGFAKLFQIHGLDFYRYSEGNERLLFTQGWAFVYPPVWLLMLRSALAAAPGSLATGDMVDSSWRTAMKAPIIGADLAVGILLLWAIPGSRVRKLLFAAIWLFHPTVWYNSAVFGQFDTVAVALLVASLIMFIRGRDRWGFILAVLAALTKQHAALPALLMIVVFSRQITFRRLVSNLAISGAIVVAISLPFVFGGNLVAYLRAVLLPAQQPAYQLPLVFAFSGSGAVLTFLHEALRWNTEHFLIYNTPVLIAATVFAAIICYFRRVRIEQAALIGILLFVGIFYRVNYQYLTIYIPLALFCLATSRSWLERGVTLALIVVPAAWVWLYDVTFWFRYLAPRVLETPTILEKLGLNHYVPDVVYVILAGVLMCLCFAYVIAVLSRRSRVEMPETSSPGGLAHLPVR